MGDPVNPVFAFIGDCLKIIKGNKDDTVTLFAINELEQIVVNGSNIDNKTADNISKMTNIKQVLDKITASAASLISVEEAKGALGELLPSIGYTNTKDTSIYIKDTENPAVGNNFYAIKVDTGNAWAINKHPVDGVTHVYGGKKRRTNRRKHRRSNRKTLGRKK
uniref:Uncharacterized protein n=1 Tax=viral metagenome TaxID=1070528 RepID=A0A6C0DCH1_9ZZZZ